MPFGMIYHMPMMAIVADSFIDENNDDAKDKNGHDLFRSSIYGFFPVLPAPV